MPDYGRWTSSGGDPSLNEINRADRFFESLAAKQPVYSTDPAEAELAFLLSGWRDDVRDAPITVPVTPRDAVEALQGGMAKNRGSRRSFAVVGSVAAAMLCIGGFGTAVYGAGPGDTLYGMRTALFGQSQVTRDDRVELASAQLAQVQQLIDNGQWQEAQDKLVAVSTTVQDVGQVEQKQQLVEQWNALTYKVVEQDPAATLPQGEPLPALPSSPLTWLPVPVVEATTSSSTSTSSTSTSPSDTTVTTTTDSSAPAEGPQPGESTTPSTPPTSPQSSTSSAAAEPTSAAPPSSVPASATSPVTTTAPPAAAPPPTSSTTVPPSTTTTTTTTTTVLSREPAAVQPPPTSAAPPVVRATSTAVAPAPALASTPAPAAVAPAEPTRPVTSPPPGGESVVTTTVLPPS